MNRLKNSLLFRIVCSISVGLLLGPFLPTWIIGIFSTFNELFSSFLSFCIPLIIVGLVAPSIANLGSSAGKLLGYTVAISYVSTLLAGFSTYFTCLAIFPSALSSRNCDRAEQIESISAFFTVEAPPIFGVMTALILAFILGIGISKLSTNTIKTGLDELKTITERIISFIIVPLLPLFILGIFLNLSSSGAAYRIISMFAIVIVVLFALHLIYLLFQFSVAGFVVKRNPFILFRNMLPAYFTALGTSSSAATIPVTLSSTLKNGVSDAIANFTIPLCATIHLSGSTMKLVGMSLAICIIQDIPYSTPLYIGFIAMIGILMIAAPGVPGGAILAATETLRVTLNFDDTSVGLMIAVYMAVDSFGTACNVTGDGAIALIIDKINNSHAKPLEPLESEG